MLGTADAEFHGAPKTRHQGLCMKHLGRYFKYCTILCGIARRCDLLFQGSRQFFGRLGRVLLLVAYLSTVTIRFPREVKLSIFLRGVGSALPTETQQRMQDQHLLDSNLDIETSLHLDRCTSVNRALPVLLRVQSK